MYKILMADDEPLELEALENFIRNSNLEIEEIIMCASGEEAVRAIMVHKPEIILLDINMPGIDGLTVLEQIHRMDYPNRVILSTAYDYFDYVVKALRLGAMDFLVKPVKKERVISVITHAVDELDEQAEQAGANARMKQVLDMMENKILKALVMGDIQEEDLYYLEMEGISYETEGKVFTVVFPQEEIPADEQKGLGNRIKQELDCLDLRVILSWKKTMLTIIVFMPNGKGQGMDRAVSGAAADTAVMDRAVRAVLKKSGYGFFIAEGDVFDDLSMIEKSFVKARENVGDLMKEPEEKPNIQEVPEDVEKICHYIGANYSSRLTLDAIADKAGYSKYYVNRLFKKYKGTTVMDYLIHIRIEQAKAMLRSENYSVKQISKMVGYTEPNYFILTFKKLEGMSPLKYRYRKED